VVYCLPLEEQGGSLVMVKSNNPKHILLLDGVYKIKYKYLKDSIIGQIKHDSKVIEIDKIILTNKNHFNTTILHELGHHFATYYNIDSGNDELFCNAFAKFVLSIVNQRVLK